MSRREDIDNAIWSDPDVLELSANAKLLYLWSFTNQRCGMAGLYKVAKRSILLETGLDQDALTDALNELQDGRFLFYDGRVIWVRSRVKHLRTKSPSIAKAIHSDLERVAGHPFVEQFEEQYGGLGWLYADPAQGPRDPQQTPSTPPTDPLDTPARGSCDPHEGSQGKGKGKEGGAGGNHRRKPQPPDPDAYPPDLPDHLRPAADQAVAVLTRVADAKGAKPITRAAIGRVIADYPDHDHQHITGEFEQYWVYGRGASTQRTDIALTYRRRLADLPAPHRNLRPLPSTPGLADAVERLNAGQARLQATTPPNGDAA